MNYSTIIYKEKDRIAKITLNRPDVLNAINSVMRDELIQAMGEIAKNDDIGVLILTGAGRAFCAGRDLKEALRFEQATSNTVGAMEKIRDLSIPTICAVNGYAVTGGLELVISFDIIVASENAMFADTHARAGLVPGGGMSQLLPRLVGPNRAKELSFTGKYIPAQEALRIGLVNRVVPADQLLPVAEEMAKDILSCNQMALQKGKYLINKGMNNTLEAGLVLEKMENLRWRESRQKSGSDQAEQTREQLLKKGRAQGKKKSDS
ncbi:enoyl-CoA hydratase [Chloroflexota bacterium]